MVTIAEPTQMRSCFPQGKIGMTGLSFLAMFVLSVLSAVAAGRMFFWYNRESAWLQAFRRNLNTTAGASGLAVSIPLMVLSLLFVIPPPLGLLSMTCVSFVGLLALLHPRMVTARLGGGLLLPSLPGLALTLSTPLLLLTGLLAPLLYAILGLAAVIPTVAGIGFLFTRLGYYPPS